MPKANPIQLTETPWRTFLPSPSEMTSYDAENIAMGTSSIELMERAGKAIFKSVEKELALARKNRGTILVLCGAGNNGGDGFVIARLLKQKKFKVRVILASAPRYSDECVRNLSRALKLKIPVTVVPKGNPALFGLVTGYGIEGLETVSQEVESASLIFDAVLGTGLRDAPSGEVGLLLASVREAIQAQAREIPVIAVDCPSGVNMATGEAYSPHLDATVTVSVELLKRGMLQYPGRSSCGEIRAVSAGIECRVEPEFSIIDSSEELLPERAPDSHKGSAGAVLVIAGSKEMPGASILSSIGALYSGAGLVYKAHQESLPYLPTYPELIVKYVSDTQGVFTPNSLKGRLEKLLDSVDSVVCGPGIGQESDTVKFLEELLFSLKARRIPAIFDADALNIFASRNQSTDLSGFVITPHPGEAARLLNFPTAEVQRDRYRACKNLYERYGAVSVLKGAGTVIFGAGKGYVCADGNPYMATPGSGDVLSGVIGTMLAQKLPAVEAAKIAVSLHARAGDYLQRSQGGSIVASDIAKAISGRVGSPSRP